MRFTYLFFSLLLCLSSYAQPNPINRRAMAIAGLASSSGWCPDPSGGCSIYAWWVAKDYTNGYLITTSQGWVDRIQKFNFGIFTTGQVTNQANGFLWPDNSAGQHNVCTNNVIAAGTNQTVALFLNISGYVTGQDDVLYTPWDFSDAVQGVAATHGGLGFHAGDSKWEWGSIFTGGPALSAAALTTGVNTDLIIVQSNTTMYAYVDGTQTASFTRTPTTPNGYPWRFFGGDSGSSAYGYFGYVTQILVWSNALTFTQVGNVHSYRTSNYP